VSDEAPNLPAGGNISGRGTRDNDTQRVTCECCGTVLRSCPGCGAHRPVGAALHCGPACRQRARRSRARDARTRAAEQRRLDERARAILDSLGVKPARSRHGQGANVVRDMA